MNVDSMEFCALGVFAPYFKEPSQTAAHDIKGDMKPFQLKSFYCTKKIFSLQANFFSIIKFIQNTKPIHFLISISFSPK